jgi:hypothetical protein
MFQNFYIQDGCTHLNYETAGVLMNMTRPKSDKLYRLMREYGKYSLEGFTILDYRRTYYRDIDWGLCPEVICGEVCVEKTFFLFSSGIIISGNDSGSSSGSGSGSSKSPHTGGADPVAHVSGAPAAQIT